MPDAQRPAKIVQIAAEIHTLPAGFPKLKLAVALTQAATQGEVGRDALQAAANALAQALTESPQPAGKDGRPALPYMELGKLARYAKISTSFSDPMLTKAEETLTADEAEAGKIDFTLKDLNGKKVTLSALRGKIVLIDFWGMECMTCHREMTDLDLIYTHYQSQGLVILSITSENPFNVNKFFTNSAAYHPPVLLDDNGKVGKEFHIDGVPRSFVFDREGKLVAQSIDMCDQHQLYVMLAKAGLHP